MTQLLNSPATRIDQRLLKVLQEIVQKVEIQPDLNIYHADYKNWELPPEAISRLQKMPEEMQQKYLSLQLRSFLYGIYYNGSLQKSHESDREMNRFPLDLENNTVLGVDLGFYQRIHESNKGEGYFDPGWSVLREESDGTLAVTKGGLRLHIEPDRHLLPTEKSPQVGELVAIRLPKNRVQNGFYMAVGDANSVRVDSTIVRIYFNLTSDGAVSVMETLTQQLNAKMIPFSFKVLYNPKDYVRHDSGVLYFDKQNYPEVKEVLQEVYEEIQSYFKPEIPLFTLQLTPGLGLAEEPNMKFAELESFGLNRCQIVANGLLEAWHQGDNSSENRMQEILKQFSQLEIDIQKPYLNANSEDIYTIL